MRWKRRPGGLLTAILGCSFLAGGCTLDRLGPQEVTPSYELPNGLFAERAPAGACTVRAKRPVHFVPDVQQALDTLGCTAAAPCHGAGGGGLKLLARALAAAAEQNYREALARLDACDRTARLLTRPGLGGSPTFSHMAQKFPEQPAFQVLIDWVESCAPLSADDPGAGCGAGAADGGTGADAPGDDAPDGGTGADAPGGDAPGGDVVPADGAPPDTLVTATTG